MMNPSKKYGTSGDTTGGTRRTLIAPRARARPRRQATQSSTTRTRTKRRFMRSEAFLAGRGSTRQSLLLLALLAGTLCAAQPERSKAVADGARGLPADLAFQP